MAKINAVATTVASKVVPFANKYGAPMLTGTGIALGCATVYVAFNAKEKILSEVEKLDDMPIQTEKEFKKKRALIFAKHTWPIAVLGGCSVACVLGANKILTGKNAALAATCGALGKELIDKDEAIEKLFGKEEAEKVEHEIAETRFHEAEEREEVKAQPYGDILITGTGNDLCLDCQSGRLFYSSKAAVRDAVLSINEKLNIDGSAFLNDFYDELNLPNTDSGDILGWTLYTDSVREGKLYVTYDSCLTKDGRPCLAIKYRVNPCYDGDAYYYGRRG